jgi:hypothetical protein
MENEYQDLSDFLVRSGLTFLYGFCYLTLTVCQGNGGIAVREGWRNGTFLPIIEGYRDTPNFIKSAMAFSNSSSSGRTKGSLGYPALTPRLRRTA